MRTAEENQRRAPGKLRLEAAPQAPHIWIFPPTPAADSIIVNPIYPPEYEDFIFGFPAGSGGSPLYIVFSIRRKGLPEATHHYHQAPKVHEITGFADLTEVKAKTPRQGGGYRTAAAPPPAVRCHPEPAGKARGQCWGCPSRRHV